MKENVYVSLRLIPQNLDVYILQDLDQFNLEGVGRPISNVDTVNNTPLLKKQTSMINQLVLYASHSPAQQRNTFQLLIL